MLRRSPAAVVHQDRHHTVVLTELFPDTLLDRIPGIVIELNVCQELGGTGVTVLALKVRMTSIACSIYLLLGNVVISKKFLRTRKIMVMHSNEGRV